MRSDAFENFYLSFWYSTFNKNKEVEIFFKLFFQHREEFLKINFCYWSFDVIGKNFSFRD